MSNEQTRPAVAGPLDQPVGRPVPERAALVRMPFEMLAALLHLPPGARIDTVIADPAEDRMATIRVRDAGWVTKPGNRICWSTAKVTEYRDDSGICFKRVIEWDMPLNV